MLRWNLRQNLLRDGAWYDVSAFLSYRVFESGDPELRIRFSGFVIEEVEWINVRKCVRHRSLPCEPGECVAVLPGDLILCFQEGKEQALYFDAHILDAQRRRHDVRGCRCCFLVCYDHDQSEHLLSIDSNPRFSPAHCSLLFFENPLALHIIQALVGINLVACLHNSQSDFLEAGIHGRIFASNNGGPLPASVMIKRSDYGVNASKIFGDFIAC